MCGDLIYCFMHLTSSVNGQWPVDDITNTNTNTNTNELPVGIPPCVTAYRVV